MIEAVGWAFRQKGLSAMERLALVSLADYANEELECYPSVKALEDKTCMDRKTIFCVLSRLKDAGLIEDTGTRKGHTKQITVYRLKGCHIGNCSENGTVPFFLTNSPENGTGKESQKRNTEPSVLNRKETSTTPTPSKGAVACAEFEEFWASILPGNRIAKGKAREAWKQALKKGASPEDIMSGVDDYRRYEKKRKHQNDYRPLHPSTWLNQERWEDNDVTQQPVEHVNGNGDAWIEQSIYG